MTTSCAIAFSVPGVGNRYDGPWMWTAAITSPERVGDRGRDRRDPGIELLDRPGIAAPADLPESLADRLGVGQGVGGEPLERGLGQVALDRRGRPERQQHLPR